MNKDIWGYGNFKKLMALRFLFFFIGFTNHFFHYWVMTATLKAFLQGSIKYLTKWGNHCADFYFLAAALSMMLLQNASVEKQQKAVRFLSRWQHVITTFQWVIVVVYWVSIHSKLRIARPGLTEIQYQALYIQHMPHLVLLLVEGFYSNIPINLTAFNLLYPLVFGYIYLAWNLMYYVRWGIVIYLNLDWGKTPEAIGFVIGVSLFGIFGNCLTIVYRKLSIRHWENKVKSE